jgi:hypothetical protein
MPIKLTIFGISKTKKRYPFFKNKIMGSFFMNLIIPEKLALFSKELHAVYLQMFLKHWLGKSVLFSETLSITLKSTGGFF